MKRNITYNESSPLPCDKKRQRQLSSVVNSKQTQLISTSTINTAPNRPVDSSSLLSMSSETLRPCTPQLAHTGLKNTVSASVENPDLYDSPLPSLQQLPPTNYEMAYLCDNQTVHSHQESCDSKSRSTPSLSDSPFSLSQSSSTTSLVSEYYKNTPANSDRPGTGYSSLSSQTRSSSTAASLAIDDDFPEAYPIPSPEAQSQPSIHKPCPVRLKPVSSVGLCSQFIPIKPTETAPSLTFERTKLGWRGSGGILLSPNPLGDFGSLADIISEIEDEALPTTSSSERRCSQTYLNEPFSGSLSGSGNESDSDDDSNSSVLTF